ncbi:hypothetical protein H0E87_020644, partial [Populus deltoides]
EECQDLHQRVKDGLLRRPTVCTTTGIKKTSINGEVNSDILLQLSNRVSDVPISKVSENDFSEEECQDLHQRVKDGLLRRPTVAEFEEKARSLHEIITKN